MSTTFIGLRVMSPPLSLTTRECSAEICSKSLRVLDKSSWLLWELSRDAILAMRHEMLDARALLSRELCWMSFLLRAHFSASHLVRGLVSSWVWSLTKSLGMCDILGADRVRQ